MEKQFGIGCGFWYGYETEEEVDFFCGAQPAVTGHGLHTEPEGEPMPLCGKHLARYGRVILRQAEIFYRLEDPTERAMAMYYADGRA